MFTIEGRERSMLIHEVICGRCSVFMPSLGSVAMSDGVKRIACECPTCGQKVFVYLKDLIEKEEKKPLKQYGRKVMEITDFFGGKK